MKDLKEYKEIILASKSPRRLEILNSHGIYPFVMPTDADESLPVDIDMKKAVKLLSMRKAEACFDAIISGEKSEYPSQNGNFVQKNESYDHKNSSLIIAADTVVYTEKLGIMGKPADRDEAFLMLSTIRNTSHFVATGVTLIDTTSGDARTFCEVTEVWCEDYSDEDIYDYIDAEQPYDKAGSYAIQGAFKKYIDHISGDYENVVGLPYNRILRELSSYDDINCD